MISTAAIPKITQPSPSMDFPGVKLTVPAMLSPAIREAGTAKNTLIKGLVISKVMALPAASAGRLL